MVSTDTGAGIFSGSGCHHRILPEKWDIADALSILYYLGYATAANLDTEIIAQMLLQTVGYEKAVQIMPVNVNPDDPEDTGAISIPPARDLFIFDTLITGLSPYTQDRYLRAGSNNWAVSPSLSATGSAILCGDPHLDPRVLPVVWYPVGLVCLGIRAVGANIPGMAMGRTEHIALAMTNNYGDMQDLYIERIDPDNPDRYLEGDTSIAFDIRIECLKRVPMVCLNWVFADALGNIGHQASGSIPIRKNGQGTFPYPFTDTIDNWLGWIDPDEMPGVLNPDAGWVGTCNHKTITGDYPYPGSGKPFEEKRPGKKPAGHRSHAHGRVR
jgi:acyl-homoserine lactone acylase PvdQ